MTVIYYEKEVALSINARHRLSTEILNMHHSTLLQYFSFVNQNWILKEERENKIFLSLNNMHIILLLIWILNKSKTIKNKNKEKCKAYKSVTLICAKAIHKYVYTCIECSDQGREKKRDKYIQKLRDTNCREINTTKKRRKKKTQIERQRKINKKRRKYVTKERKNEK